jgi:hypothetical protein
MPGIKWDHEMDKQVRYNTKNTVTDVSCEMANPRVTALEPFMSEPPPLSHLHLTLRFAYI